MQGMSMVSSKLGICALKGGISVCLWLFDPIKQMRRTIVSLCV
jgi:hypothetical protein